MHFTRYCNVINLHLASNERFLIKRYVRYLIRNCPKSPHRSAQNKQLYSTHKRAKQTQVDRPHCAKCVYMSICVTIQTCLPYMLLRICFANWWQSVAVTLTNVPKIDLCVCVWSYWNWCGILQSSCADFYVFLCGRPKLDSRTSLSVQRIYVLYSKQGRIKCRAHRFHRIHDWGCQEHGFCLFIIFDYLIAAAFIMLPKQNAMLSKNQPCSATARNRALTYRA